MREFVNTRDIDDDLDDIATPQALQGWVAEHGLGDGSATAADVTRFADVREGLRALMLENNGEPLDRDSRGPHGRGGAIGAPERELRRGLRAAAGGRGARRRARRDPGSGLRVHARQDLRAPEGLSRAHLRMGVLRPLAEPVGHVVLHGSVRKPRQGTHLPQRRARQRASGRRSANVYASGDDRRDRRARRQREEHGRPRGRPPARLHLSRLRRHVPGGHARRAGGRRGPRRRRRRSGARAAASTSSCATATTTTRRCSLDGARRERRDPRRRGHGRQLARSRRTRRCARRCSKSSAR